jgi:putative ABC transport system permease protein
MSPLNSLLTALRGLLANKLRAVLTTLGIIIGVASVIATLALGNGARAAVEESFRFLGSDEIQIGAKKAIEDGSLVPYGKPLTYEDGLLMPSSVELVDRVDMSVQGKVKVRRGRIVLDTVATGLTADATVSVIAAGEVQPAGWPEGEPLTVEAFFAQGRFFTADEALADAAVCVLGFQTAEDLFEGDDPLGETMWVNRRRCLVLGVLAELEATDPQRGSYSEINEGLIMPIGTAIHTLHEETGLGQDAPSVDITAHITGLGQGDKNKMGEAKVQIATYLRGRHGIERDAVRRRPQRLSSQADESRLAPVEERRTGSDH